MKNKSLLPILLLAAFTLGACNTNGQKSQESKEEPATSEVQPTTSEDTTQYSVAIANKEALQGDWFVGSSLDLDLTLSPAANPLLELGKNLTVTSSDPEVVAVTGLGLSGLKAGNAKITVKYHEATDDVDVVILANTPQGKYGVEHDGTLQSPFTNEEALLAAKSPRYAGEDYYVKGIVDSFYHAPGSRDDGACSFFLQPAQEGGERFEVYKCYKEGTGAASYLTADDIWKGGEVVAHGKFTSYNGQYETSSAIFVSCTGNKPQPPQIVEKTFAEALALGVALKDGDDSYDYIKFQGYVAKKSGTDFYLTATKGEALVSGKSDAAHGERDIYTNAIELYGAGKVEALAAKLLDGAKVEVTAVLKNYHGTVENGNTLADADVTVLEAGTQWAVPEPEVGTRTLKEFIDGENTKKLAYNVTAQIKAFKTEGTKDDYGNMTITDGTNDLIIYGSSATASALAWDNAEAYAFTNPKDFQTNDVSSALAVGNTITMKLIRADYTAKDGTVTKEGTGIITDVVAVETTGIEISAATAEVVEGKKVMLTLTRTPANSNTPATWTSSDPAVATVKGGLVTGVAEGTATITAKISDSISKQCVVTVKEADPEAAYDLTGNLNSSNTAYDKMFDVTFDDGQIWKIPGNQNLAYGVKIGGKLASATDRFLYSKSAYEKVKSVVVTHGTKDTAITVNSVKLYVYDSAALAEEGDPTKATETVVGPAYEDSKAMTFAPAAADGNWNGKFFRIVYNLSSSAASSNKGVVLTELKVVFQDVVEQPVGAFRGLVKTAAGTFIPADLTLAADSAALLINGQAATITSYKWSKAKAVLTLNTEGAYGKITASFANNVFTITGLTGAAASQLDLTYVPALSANTQYIDCSVMDIDAINNTFLRRYDAGSGWVANTPDQNKMASVEIDGRKALKCNGYSGKIGLSLKNDFAQPIPGTVIKSIGCWIYNSGETDFSVVVYAYKGAGRTSAAQLNTFTVKPGWNFYQTGVVNGSSFKTTDSMYNFQLYYQGVTSCDPVFDDFYLYM